MSLSARVYKQSNIQILKPLVELMKENFQMCPPPTSDGLRYSLQINSSIHVQLHYSPVLPPPVLPLTEGEHGRKMWSIWWEGGMWNYLFHLVFNQKCGYMFGGGEVKISVKKMWCNLENLAWNVGSLPLSSQSVHEFKARLPFWLQYYGAFVFLLNLPESIRIQCLSFAIVIAWEGAWPKLIRVTSWVF